MMVLYRSVSFLGAEEMHSETIALVLLSGSVSVWLHSVVVYNPDPFGAILCKKICPVKHKEMHAAVGDPS